MKHFTLAILALATLCTTAVAQPKTLKTIYAHNSVLDVEQLMQNDRPTQLNRILFAGYNSLCLPMSLSAEQLQQAGRDLQIERMAAIRQEDGIVNLYFLDCTTEGIEAGVPYLIYSPTTQYMRVRTTKALSITKNIQPITMTDQEGNRVTFTSSWNSIDGDGRYGIPAKQDTEILQSILQRTEPTQKFLPTRCGFVWEQQASNASALQIKHVTSLSDIQTGIKKLQSLDAVVDVYDTAGALVRSQVRISSALKGLPKGVYVIGGEKVLVK